jgi:hypothetical protein
MIPLKLKRPRRPRRGKILPFKRPAPKRPAYQPHPANGTVYAIESTLVAYDHDGNEIIVSTDFTAIHMSASGNSAGGGGGFATMAAAQSAAWKEARRKNAVFIFSTGDQP